tara:strand:+ start:92 stop:1276 length:1185 start_codon:yes stop_codon:yes gene_type:complete
MATFSNTTSPTPFGAFDSDNDFKADADNIVTFVKRKLGDDILSVELTKKQIWSNFEESVFEYGSILNQYQAKSQIVQFLGMPITGTDGHMSGSEQKYPRQNLDYLTRFAEPYASEAGIGGSYNSLSGSIQLIQGQQDYDIYDSLKDAAGNTIFSSGSNARPKTRLKVKEVFHSGPQAAYRFFDTTSAINYLNNEFTFESFTPETIFYVLPVFEDILRAGQLDLSNRVRRSNYGYEVMGTKIRIYPKPTQDNPKKLFIKVMYKMDPLNPSYHDETVGGVSNLSNIPFGNLKYTKINSIGRQWIRQFSLALSKEQLGLIRSKFGNIPIPGAELTLNGGDLVTQGREDKEKLITQLKEMLDTMTYDKLQETAATKAEMIHKQLKFIPMPNGKAIFMG